MRRLALALLVAQTTATYITEVLYSSGDCDSEPYVSMTVKDGACISLESERLQAYMKAWQLEDFRYTGFADIGGDIYFAWATTKSKCEEKLQSGEEHYDEQYLVGKYGKTSEMTAGQCLGDGYTYDSGDNDVWCTIGSGSAPGSGTTNCRAMVHITNETYEAGSGGESWDDPMWDVPTWNSSQCAFPHPYGEFNVRGSSQFDAEGAGVPEDAFQMEADMCGDATCQALYAQSIRTSSHLTENREYLPWNLDNLPAGAPEDVVSCWCDEKVYDSIFSNGVGFLYTGTTTERMCASARCRGLQKALDSSPFTLYGIDSSDIPGLADKQMECTCAAAEEGLPAGGSILLGGYNEYTEAYCKVPKCSTFLRDYLSVAPGFLKEFIKPCPPGPPIGAIAGGAAGGAVVLFVGTWLYCRRRKRLAKKRQATAAAAPIPVASTVSAAAAPPFAQAVPIAVPMATAVAVPMSGASEC